MKLGLILLLSLLGAPAFAVDCSPGSVWAGSSACNQTGSDTPSGASVTTVPASQFDASSLPPGSSYRYNSDGSYSVWGTTSGGAGGSSSSQDQQCRSDADDAKQNCISGGQASQMAMMAQMMSRNVGGGTSAFAACTALKAQGYTSLAGAMGIYAACKASIKDCTSTCGQNSTLLKRCQGYDKQVMMAMAPLLLGAGGSLLSANQCEQVIAEQQATSCTNPNNVSSLACNPQMYCAAHTLDPNCAAYNAGACNGSPAGAANPVCVALGRAGAGSGLSTTLPTGPGGVGANDGEMNPPYAGYNAPNHGGGGDGSVAGGSGGGMGGPGAYPGGPNGAPGGARDSGVKGDIGGGTGGGTAGGAVAMGNSTNGGGGGGGKSDELDLSRFLPNGDLAKRDIASGNELANKGITGPNDLSNFEKITRMMNLKRRLLNQ